MNALATACVLLAALVGVFLGLPEPPAKAGANDLSGNLSQWLQKGKMIEVFGYKVFTMHVPCTAQHEEPPTFLFIHGFPTSSFDYHLVIETLAKSGNVILYDHLGFGLSDKPDDFSYSMVDHADISLEVWRSLGIASAHVVAHDMGDSVLTEILARRDRGLLPDYFLSFFESVTFTNGGMQVDLANLRLSQRLLMTPKVGPSFASMVRWLGVDEWTQRQQLGTLWGDPAALKRDQEEISNIIALNRYKNGVARMPQAITYIHDRHRYEKSRWIPALARINIPVRLVWGDSDAVAPKAIAERIHAIVPNSELVFLRGVGHFAMLEDPDGWAQAILRPLQ